MFVCWRDRAARNETTYLNTLKQRGPPLASKLELNLAPSRLTLFSITLPKILDRLPLMYS